MPFDFSMFDEDPKPVGTTGQDSFDFSMLDAPKPGNIDLSTRPRVKNPDGTTSTVRSISINEDGHEILIPTVSDDGRVLSNDDAIDLYHRSGKHLGMFKSAADATAAAQKIHESEAAKLEPPSFWNRAVDAAKA